MLGWCKRRNTLYMIVLSVAMGLSVLIFKPKSYSHRKSNESTERETDIQIEDGINMDGLDNLKSSKNSAQLSLQWRRKLTSKTIKRDIQFDSSANNKYINKDGLAIDHIEKAPVQSSRLHKHGVIFEKTSSERTSLPESSVEKLSVHTAKLPLQRLLSNAHSARFSPERLISLLPNVTEPLKLCKGLFEGEVETVILASFYQLQHAKVVSPDEKIMGLTTDCESFRTQRQYITAPLNDEEADFPIAYSIMVHKDVEQIERLLRAIYRPQNYYCIHVDATSPPTMYQSVKTIASCFDNVFMASERVDVKWGKMSLLQSELVCLKDLLQYKTWKYLLNVAGQEWPLKTNWELVQILKAYNGANDIETAYDW